VLAPAGSEKPCHVLQAHEDGKLGGAEEQKLGRWLWRMR